MRRTLLVILALLCTTRLATGQSAPAPGSLCRRAIEAAAQAHGVPVSLMAAIGRVESGRRDPASGAWQPWPWTVDADGQGAFYDTKAQAVEAVRAQQASGMRSIDVGCMQVNLLHHPDAFASLAEALDPAANADYAARFLNDLFGQTRNWPRAAAMYHSATPELGAEYQRKVMAVWPEEQRLEGNLASSGQATAWPAALNRGGLPPPPWHGAGTRIIPLAAVVGAAPPPGRGLAAYRAVPVIPRFAAAGR